MEQLSRFRCSTINKIVRTFVVLIVLFTGYSCKYTLCYQSKYLSNSFENKDTGLDSLMNINGLYIYHNLTSYLFYKDGLFVENERNGYFSHLNWYENDDHRINNYSTVFKNIVEGKSPDTERFYRKGSQPWGIYHVVKDTIVACLLEIDSWDQYGVKAKIIKFKIEDRNTIKMIRFDYYIYATKEDIKTHNEQIDKYYRGITFSYHPLKYLPEPNKCWLLEKKWFWKNKNDWKNYTDSLKRTKR